MKAVKISYWILTGVVSLMMLYSGYAYLNNPPRLKEWAYVAAVAEAHVFVEFDGAFVGEARLLTRRGCRTLAPYLSKL